jgi:hypothetical protein
MAASFTLLCRALVAQREAFTLKDKGGDLKVPPFILPPVLQRTPPRILLVDSLPIERIIREI